MSRFFPEARRATIAAISMLRIVLFTTGVSLTLFFGLLVWSHFAGPAPIRIETAPSPDSRRRD